MLKNSPANSRKKDDKIFHRRSYKFIAFSVAIPVAYFRADALIEITAYATSGYQLQLFASGYLAAQMSARENIRRFLNRAKKR